MREENQEERREDKRRGEEKRGEKRREEKTRGEERRQEERLFRPRPACLAVFHFRLSVMNYRETVSTCIID